MEKRKKNLLISFSLKDSIVDFHIVISWLSQINAHFFTSAFRTNAPFKSSVRWKEAFKRGGHSLNISRF